MPTRPSTPCLASGCPNPAVRGGRCEEHAKQYRAQSDQARPSAAERGYDAKWRRVRAQFLRHHPECAVCGAEATVVDHVVPLSQGGTHEWANLQPLCVACHNRKTATVDGGGKNNLT